MDAPVEELLKSFEELTEAQKHELASAVLRWARLADHPPLDAEEFATAADEVFGEYDSEEAPA